MLEKAAANEYSKEIRYIEALRKKFPDNTWLKQGTTDYTTLIIQLNSALKKSNLLQQELNAEYERWKVYMENYTTVERKKRKYLKAVQTQSDDIKEKKAQYDAARRQFVGSSTLAKVGEFEKNFMKNWNKNGASIVNMIRDIVLDKFGSSLFKMKDGKLILNGAEITLLVKEIASRIYETLLFENGWTKASGTSKKRTWLTHSLDKIIDKTFQTDDTEKIVESLKNISVTNTHIGTILQNYSASGYSSVTGQQIAQALQNNNSTLNRLRQYAKKAYVKATGDTKANRGTKRYKEWIKNNPQFSDSELMRQALAMEDISVQVYYASEDRALTNFLGAGISAALQGSGHNTKSDIEAGLLTIETTTDLSNFQARLAQQQQEIFNKAMQKMETLKVDASAEGYTENYEIFLAMRQEQLELLEQFKQTLTQEELEIAEALTYFNIHTSVKDQTGNIYNEMGAGFHGGAIGKNDSALSALENVKNLYLKSGNAIEEKDLIWLKTAILNSGSGLIGAKNKSSLEAYFSMFVSYLMFDDAYNIVEDAFDENNEKYASNLPDIHLYVVNTQMIPLSYMLKKVHEELSKFSQTLRYYQNSGNQSMARTIINGYSASGNPGNRQKAWFKEGEKAVDSTKIKVILMSGFYDLLEELEKVMSANI